MELNNQINKTYIEATKGWKSLIDLKETKKITSLLNNGTFKITREEYNSLDTSSDRIHYYFGIIKTELCVLIIDSNNDAKKDHSKVLIKKLTYGVDASYLVDVDINKEAEMSPNEFHKKMFNWNLLSYNWIESKLKDNTFFRGISNPMKDLNTEFDSNGASQIKEVYHFFGLHLKKEKQEKKGKLYAVINKNLLKYEIDLFCIYVCKRDKGNEQDLEWSRPFYLSEETEDDKIKYSLFGDR